MIAIIPAALFGLLIGSFLNVCIQRWPRDLSVVRPRSRCNSCETQIAWYDNIPVVSYALLGGKCRKCGTPIGWRYPLVELLTAACFAWFVGRYGLTLVALKYCVFSALLVGLLFSDLETLLLPDEFTVGGFFIGLAFAFVVLPQEGILRVLLGLFGVEMGPRTASFVEAALGGLVPAGALWVGGWLFEKLRHKEGLGFGDVKMVAMVGVFLGIQGALMTLILGSVAGSVIGLIFIKATGKDPGTYQLPFGTFLGAAALLAAAAGNGLPG